MALEKFIPPQKTKGSSKTIKSPPYSENLEKAVLGAIMRDPGKYVELLENGFVSAFHLKKHATIALAMYDLHVAGSPADMPNTVESLTENDNLQKAGGAYYVSGLTEDNTVSFDPLCDLNKLKEIDGKRRIREKMIQLFQAGFDRPLDDIQSDFLKITESFTPDNARDAGINSIMGVPMDFWEMADYEYKRLEDFIQGILPTECILLLYGVQKVGKSLLALNLAIHLAAGKPWFHLNISKPRKTLFVSAEGGSPMLQDRIQHLKTGETIPPAKNLGIWAIPPIDVLSSSDFGGLVAAIETFQPEVIILDPLAKLHSKDENSNNEMAEVLGRLRQLVTNHGRSLILNHHARKSGDTSRGASSIAREVDSIIRLEWENKEDHTGNRRLYFEDLRHSEPPADLFLVLDFKTLVFQRTDSQGLDLVKQILEENDGKMIRKDCLRKIEDRAGVNQSRAYSIITLAHKNGLIYAPKGERDVCLKRP